MSHSSLGCALFVVLFAELASNTPATPLEFKEAASGLRLTRTCGQEPVDTHRLGEFNRRLLSYGAGGFDESVDRYRPGPPLAGERRSAGHDWTIRGQPYAMHLYPFAC